MGRKWCESRPWLQSSTFDALMLGEREADGSEHPANTADAVDTANAADAANAANVADTANAVDKANS